MPASPNSFRTGPDERGHFGIFGGRYVAETLMPLILDLAREYEKAKDDPAFQEELAYFQRDYVGRPSPIYHAKRYPCEVVWRRGKTYGLKFVTAEAEPDAPAAKC